VWRVERTQSCDPTFPSHVAPHSFAFSINDSRTLLRRLDGFCNLISQTFFVLYDWKVYNHHKFCLNHNQCHAVDNYLCMVIQVILHLMERHSWGVSTVERRCIDLHFTVLIRWANIQCGVDVGIFSIQRGERRVAGGGRLRSGACSSACRGAHAQTPPHPPPRRGITINCNPDLRLNFVRDNRQSCFIPMLFGFRLNLNFNAKTISPYYTVRYNN
jgi:hypothetical protein